MSLVDGSIPSFVNGISQQPASARLSSQGSEQENGRSSIVAGMGKRPPTHHVAKVIDGQIGSAAVHLINRDTSERYITVVTNNNIQVFDLEGNEISVDNQADDDYLVADDPSTAFRAVTIADYTFLLNREKTVAMDPRGTRYTLTVNTSHTGGNYRIDIDAQPADSSQASAAMSVNTTATNTNTSTLAAALNTALNSAIVAEGTLSINTSVTNNVITVSTAYGRPFVLRLRFTSPAVEDDITSTSISEETSGNKGMAFVRQGNYATVYSLTLAGTYTSNNATFTSTVSTTTSSTDVNTIQTSAIAAALNTALATTAAINTVFAFSTSESVISIVPGNVLYDWQLTASDSNGNRNLVAVKEQLQKFTDLPVSAANGFKTKIVGDASSEEDDFYVKMNNTRRAGALAAGAWEETVAPNIPIAFDAKTMPHQLVRQADGTFVFQRAEWDERVVGDEDSNPNPSFVGSTINDIVFFRNRLGFLADENVILSAAGPDYVRFWRKTVQAILDGDPIDVSASNVSVSILRNAVPFSSDKMLLFSDQKQFVFTGGDLLTPKTAACKPSTAYETVIECKPVAAGKAVYFATPRGEFSGVREYATDATTSVDDAVDVTAHVPAYVPAGVFKIAACPNEDMFVLLTTGDPEAMYVYKYYFVGTDKLQASWSRWPIDGTILDANFIDTGMYLLVQHEDGVYIDALSVEVKREDVGFDFEILLDRRFFTDSGDGVYTSANNRTTWTLPYETSGTVQAVIRGTPPAGKFVGQTIGLTTVSGNTSVQAVGDWSTAATIMGIQYSFEYELSELFVKQAGGNGGERPVTGGRLQVRNLSLVFSDTTYFRVTVTPTHGDTYTYFYTGRQLGEYVQDTLPLASGEFVVPVVAKSDEVSIRIINDSPFPSNFLNATWMGEFIKKARRV